MTRVQLRCGRVRNLLLNQWLSAFSLFFSQGLEDCLFLFIFSNVNTHTFSSGGFFVTQMC